MIIYLFNPLKTKVHVHVKEGCSLFFLSCIYMYAGIGHNRLNNCKAYFPFRLNVCKKNTLLANLFLLFLLIYGAIYM